MRWFWPLLVACGFGAGFVARRSPVVTALPAPSEPLACTDELAMQANANLTEQVVDYKRRWENVRSLAPAPKTPAAKAPFAVDAEEWRRMGMQDMIRVRVPCADYDAAPIFEMVQPGIGRQVTSNRLPALRAEAAGLGDPELSSLRDAYTRANARIWASIKDACPGEDEETTEDAPRIRQCRRAVLDARKPAVRDAIREVAAARFAGAVTMRGGSPEARVLFALAASTDPFFEEIVQAIGRENAKRAVDHGVVCVDEIVYHVPPPVTVEEPEVVDID